MSLNLDPLGCLQSPLYLAFDLSTQTLKALAIDEDLNLVFESAISFDNELPDFGTIGGVKKNGLKVTSPVLMWVQAVDLLMSKLSALAFPFHHVRAISGTAQQHGSVYWKNNAEKTLRELDPKKSLFPQLKDSFALSDCPVWMDASTSEWCAQLEDVAGGPDELAKMTGSRAYERFTGNQIAKIYHLLPENYQCCERISLVSSFLASLFVGYYAPIDFSDGSGMNLLNIHSKQWEKKLIDACSPDLMCRLGSPVSSNSVIGCLSEYMTHRYGFCKDCIVVAFTGDNPASFAGMCLEEGDVALSLGTSDTLMFPLKKPKPCLSGHVFVSPLDDNCFMAMLCYKNGSLTREFVRNSVGIYSWTAFENSLSRTVPGNSGNIGIYLIEQEIFPFAKGIFRINSQNERVEYFEKDVEIRALVEGQFLAKRLHSEKLGFHPCRASRIIVTGGASRNVSIVQIIADVFNCPVYGIDDTANSACLGSAYRARSLAQSRKHADSVAYSRKVRCPSLVASPNRDAVKTYNGMLKRYLDNETFLLS